jgi:4-amino-4-deoxy-L-arabinose transferase-like glycosyltransferase
MVQSINVLLGTLVVVGVYRLAFHHFEHRIALRLAWVAALFPSLVLYSAITMREVFVTYPLVLGLIQFSTWLSSRSPKHFILGTLFFLLAGTFHYAILMCYITFVGLFFVINFVKTMKYGNGVQIVIQTSAALVGAPVMIWLVLNYQTDFGRLADVIGDLPKLLQLIDKTMSSRVAGRLAYLQGAEIKTFGDLLTLMPLRVAYFLFSPFPWELQAAADAFLSLDGMLYAVLVGASIRSLVKRHASRSTWPIFAAIVTMAAIFSFGTSNSGTAFRHRAKIAPLLIAVSASLVRPHRSSARSRDVHAAAAIDSGV